MIGQDLKILLIDDDEDDYVEIRDLLGDVKRTRYKIEWQSTYESGLAALKNGTYDACLLDYFLGKKTGLDFLEEAKAFTACPIIFLTGVGDHDTDLVAMQTGASDFLVKGQITSGLIDRSIRYSVKHARDVQEIKEREIQILQQDRLASLGLLASSLAHEIGTPLGIIRGRAELIAKKFSHEAGIKSDMEIITSQIDRVTKLANSLLHIARGQHTEVAASVSLNLVVQDVLNLMSHELSRKSIELDSQIPQPTYVRAEAGPLGQVLLNLLVNSVHAIEEARKSEKAGPFKVSLTAREEDEKIEISLSDNGCGISEKNLGQLFKPFFTTKDIGQGTGLGLATSYRLIQSWKGSIQVESTEGVGTTFRIRLLKARPI